MTVVYYFVLLENLQEYYSQLWTFFSTHVASFLVLFFYVYNKMSHKIKCMFLFVPLDRGTSVQVSEVRQ